MKRINKTYYLRNYDVIPAKAGIHVLIFFLLIIHPVGMILIADEDIPASSSGDLDFYVDYALFNQEKEIPFYCEFYLMLYAGQIKGEILNGEYVGTIEIHKVLKNLESGVRKEHRWQTEIKMDQDSLRNRTLAIYDQWTDNLEPALYEVDVRVIDMNTDIQGTASLKITVKEEDHNKDISQIQFISGVEKSSVRDQFYKNGRKIHPNPSRRYGFLSPQLYFYYELYNLDNLTGDYIDLIYSVTGKIDSVNKIYPSKKIKIPGKTVSIVHGLDVSQYPSGVYKLQISVTDDSKDVKMHTGRQFEVIQNSQLMASARVNEAQIKSASDIMIYFISPQQLKFFNSLDVNGKTQFLINFWSDKDPTPNSKKNEYLEEIQKRYQYANEHFYWGNKEGWASEKGRVLIVYGFPEETIQKYSDSETVPYEIWIYREDRSYEFVFADLKSTGNFILVHSTRENEIHNGQWQDLVGRM